MSGIESTRRLGMLPTPSQSPVRPMFKTLGIAASGLSAQRQRMDAIAFNIANADVTRGADGQPYKRRDAILEAATPQNAMYGDQASGSGSASSASRVGSSAASAANSIGDSARAIEVPVLPLGSGTSGPESGEYGVRVVGIAEDQGEGRKIYEPGHPDADADGYVRYPNINTTQEQVKLMEARRLYEANVAVFQTTKSILRASLDI